MIDYRDINYLCHHGVKGQKWGVENGPPYPLNSDISTGNRLKNSNNITEDDLKKKYYTIANHNKNIDNAIINYQKDEKFIEDYEYIESKTYKQLLESPHLDTARKVTALMQYLDDPNPDNYSYWDMDKLGNIHWDKAKNRDQVLKILYNSDAIAAQESDEGGDIYRGWLAYNGNTNEKDWNKLAYLEEKRSKELLNEYNKEMKKIGGKAYLEDGKDPDFPKLILEVNDKKYVEEHPLYMSKYYQNRKMTQEEINKIVNDIDSNWDLINKTNFNYDKSYQNIR